MSIHSSFPKVADQIIAFNKNVIDILSKIDNLTTTDASTVNVQLYDDEGVLQTYTMPSFTSLKSEIDRLNNNINSLYSINDTGSYIQSSSENKYKKIITVDLNRDPTPISTLGIVESFKPKTNWFFDSMIDPMMQVELDLSGKIEHNVSRCLVRRYIIEFEKGFDGLTNLGQSALNSFNSLFRGNVNILKSEFEEWHRTTPGVVNPMNPKYDEDTYELEPNNTLYDGEFNVLRIQEDRLNRKLWYVLNTLDYIYTDTSEIRQLSIDDELIINIEKSSSRYKVIEISNVESNPRIRVERIEGIEPISVGIKTLKIYSPIIYTNKLRVNISYDERNIIFIKPINTDNNLVAKKWSLGTGYYTNDLRLETNDNLNGFTMEKFYTEYVYDYGEVLRDLVAKKVPNKLAGVPLPPELNSDNFKVVQINKHLTDATNSKEIKKKHNTQLNLKSEILQIDNAILDRSKKLKVSNFGTISEKKQSELEINDLISKKESKGKLLTTLNDEIIALASKPISTVKPKFRIRGFWKIPSPVESKGSLPQEIIQFKIEYRYLSEDGSESPIDLYKIDNEEQQGSFSNWTALQTEVRRRIYDEETDSYFWELNNLDNPDAVNINQLDIPIQTGERVEIRIKSISEAGWPESPMESPWSDIITVEFPDDLSDVLNENEFILDEAMKEDVRLSLTNELKSKGLDEHLMDTVVDNNGRTYLHKTDNILSGFKDENGNPMDLFVYLRNLEDKVRGLEEKLSRARGILDVSILRNSQEFKIVNGSETVFNVECEDYLNKVAGPGIPTGRVYENSIYVIRDFVVRIRNGATSPLGLLSDKIYLSNKNVYDQNAPQIFWVNEHDELLKSDATSRTRTQLNNQFIWSVNYDSSNENSVVKLSENIGNDYSVSNSITSVLGSSEYNIGYNELDILAFGNNNNSLLETSKWIDSTISVGSTDKLLTSIHPVIRDLESIVETNSQLVKVIEGGEQNDIIVPINIYFKMNALDQNQTGVNYEYIDLNRKIETVKHIKKIKLSLENESENRPFSFTIKFNINRNNVIVRKAMTSPVNINIK